MSRSARHSTHPWLRSTEENIPRRSNRDRHLTVIEMLAVAAVLAAVVTMAVWFIFFSAHGIGPGTV
jgi:hypothetical protein